MSASPEITETIARKVLSVVDAGLIKGAGNADKNNRGKPGQMCVEAAVCYALDLPHGDDPACVSRALRSLKIRLNDSSWSNNKARAAGLRRLAVAQLGSRGHLDDKEFARRVAELAIRKSVPVALRAAASINKNPADVQALKDAANRCEVEGTRQSSLNAREVAQKARKNAYAAYAASAYAASAYAASAYAASAYAASAYAASAYAASAYAASAYAAYAASAYAAYAAYAAAYADAYADAADAYADAADAAADAAAAASAYAAYAAYAAAYADAYADAADAYADAADAAADAAAAAAYAARDKSLADFAEGVVQILIDMKAPGCQWLALTEIAA